MSTENKVLELELCEEGSNVLIQDVLVDVTANNNQVALRKTGFKFLMEVFKEGLSWVAVIVMVVEVNRFGAMSVKPSIPTYLMFPLSIDTCS